MRVVDGVAGSVGGPGRVAGADRALGAVVVVDGFARKDEIALAVAVMLVIAEHRSGGNRHARVKPALVGKLFVKDLLDPHRTNPIGARLRAYHFHVVYFTIFRGGFSQRRFA